MKNGEPITKSILIADLPAGDKPWSCRPTMPAVRRLSVVTLTCNPCSGYCTLCSDFWMSKSIKKNRSDKCNGFTAGCIGNL